MTCSTAHLPTKMSEPVPRVRTSSRCHICAGGLVQPSSGPEVFTSSIIRRDHAFLKDEAAVEAPFPGLDHAVGFFCELVEGKPFDCAHRQRASLRCIDFDLHVALYVRDFAGLADDLHA